MTPPPGPAQPPPVEVIAPRLVPLGGPRAMTVRRTLPAARRPLVGAWCFADHYGPDVVADTGGMVVPPHPHTGLQTVSWLFTGEVEHRDSAGHHAVVRPGELNLMTAGRGISHSELSTPGTRVLHGVQLWVALPDGARFTEPGFEHYVPPALDGAATGAPGVVARVFLGALLGHTSPVRTHTPLLGAELLLEPGADLRLPVEVSFEHGLLLDTGTLTVEGASLGPAELAYLAPGTNVVHLRVEGPQAVRALLLGGPPFGEQIVMWWNFVGRSHAEIVTFRARWQAELGDSDRDSDRDGDSDGGAQPFPDSPTAVRGHAFRLPDGDPLPPLPAPVLPAVRLRPRG